MSGFSSSGDDRAIVITGIGVISPDATSALEVAAALQVPAGEGTYRSLDRFEPERFLGKRGFKYMMPAARYAVAAARLAADDAGLTEPAYAPEEMGVFLGTTCAAHATLEAMDRTVIAEGAESIQPMEAPNFSINLAASSISMRQQLKAFNVTLTTPLVSGLEALILGAQSIRKGRARMVLAGATEDTPPERLGALFGYPLAQGASCLMALESLDAARQRGVHIYGQVAGGVLGFVSPDMVGAGRRAQVAELIDTYLDRLLPAGCEQVALALFYLDFSLCHSVNQAILEGLRRRGLQVSLIPRTTAGEISVSPVLSLVSLAVTHGEGLVVAVSPQGQMAMIRLEPVEKGLTKEG